MSTSLDLVLFDILNNMIIQLPPLPHPKKNKEEMVYLQYESSQDSAENHQEVCQGEAEDENSKLTIPKPKTWNRNK